MNNKNEKKIPFDHIATRFYSSIDCEQQSREIFREQTSKQTPNSFVTCCNTIATITTDDSKVDFMNDNTTIIRCQIPQLTSLRSVPEILPTINDERVLIGLQCLSLGDAMSILTTMPVINDDESFLSFEQACKMDSDVFVDRSRRKTTIKTNLAAVMMDEKMEADYPDKKNMIHK